MVQPYSMNAKNPCSVKKLFAVSAAVLVTVFARTQEEQSANSSTSASTRYWTAPRVQQEPPRVGNLQPFHLVPDGADRLRIENETLVVRANNDGNNLSISDKASRQVFITDASFNTTGGSAKV